MTIRTNTADSTKCPSCGGNLVFSVSEQALTCSFCGNSFSPEKLDLLKQIKIYDTETSDTKENDKNEIVCNACGARVITEKNTTSTFCAFCGSPSLVTQRLTKRFRPDYVIPFKITKEEAQRKIREFAKTGKYVPGDFFANRNLKRLTGVYVPFWLMNSRCKLHANGIAFKNHIDGRDKYNIISDMDIRFKNVPFDGAIDFEDDLMESVEPFDYSELKPFTTSYLQGFYAQRYDLTADRLSDRILGRLQRYGRESVGASLAGYDAYENSICLARPYELQQSYAMLPIWLMTYEYGGRIYKIAVNGQTGKVDGFLPVNKFKRAMRIALYYAHNVTMCLPLLIPVALLSYWGYYNLEAFYFIIFIIMVVLIFSAPLLVIYKNAKVVDDDFDSKDYLAPVKNLLRKFFTRRKKTLMRIKQETNMLISNKPSVTEYYDTTAKIDSEIVETLQGRESYFMK